MNDLRITRLAILALATIGLSGCALNKPVDKAPVVTQVQPKENEAVTPPVATPVELAPPTNNTGAELRQLIQDHAVNELRTSYNGNYGASQLFNPKTLDYYIALFHKKEFWRVTKTQDQARAEQLYQKFSEKTHELAQVDLRKIRLEADYAHTEAKLSERTAQLDTLQNDLQAQRQQASVISSQQATARQETERLAQQQRDATKQLRQLQRTIKELEAQQSRLQAK